MRQVMAATNTLPLELRMANLERQVGALTAEIHAMRQALDTLVALAQPNGRLAASLG
jgi:hypothetical protein